jgi:hypothetical protein
MKTKKKNWPVMTRANSYMRGRMTAKCEGAEGTSKYSSHLLIIIIANIS